MKKLHNNFTTPEQSRQLLKLGLSAETADCVLENLDTAENDFAAKDYTRWIIEERHVKADIFTENNKGIFLPCWSVGRLIEIAFICSGVCAIDFWRNDSPMDDIIYEFEKNKMDFSKLED